MLSVGVTGIGSARPLPLLLEEGFLFDMRVLLDTVCLPGMTSRGGPSPGTTDWEGMEEGWDERLGSEIEAIIMVMLRREGWRLPRMKKREEL